MKRKKKRYVWFAVILVFSVMAGRITWLNIQYPDPEEQVKAENEPFELAGYRFSLKKISLLEGEEYSKISKEASYMTLGDGRTTYPADRQRVIIAAMQVERLNGRETILDLSEAVLENHAWHAMMNPELFYALNPNLGGNMTVEIKEKDMLEIQCPFMALDLQFTEKQWEELNVDDFGIVLNYYPKKVIFTGKVS